MKRVKGEKLYGIQLYLPSYDDWYFHQIVSEYQCGAGWATVKYPATYFDLKAAKRLAKELDHDARVVELTHFKVVKVYQK